MLFIDGQIFFPYRERYFNFGKDEKSKMEKKFICDKGCGCEFDLNIMSRQVSLDVTQKYFVCPECGCFYHAIFTTWELNVLISRQGTLRRQLSMIQRSGGDGHKIKRKIEKLQTEIKAYQNHLECQFADKMEG